MANIVVPSRTKELKGTEKRDTLRVYETQCQDLWAQQKLFEADAPSIADIPLDSVSAEQLRKDHPKWFQTIAYPYMNGVLHIGHAFSWSKTEFTAGVQRLMGKNTLWPQGYHCTGLPIKACADKLAEEVKKFGSEFEHYKEEEVVEEGALPTAGDPTPTKSEDVTKHKATKGKANAKTVKAKYQFQIMQTMGIPTQEIHRFADAEYWLEFFSPMCKQHLTEFGARIDWRRQFVTTDANPYYDAFVRWQMRRLKELNKIKFGKRYTIYSVKDGQPCMDHDRSEGEGVGPQEYTALKLRVKQFSEKFATACAGKLPENAEVHLIPATLRPETMYGQLCVFVGPKLKYGVFKAAENQYWVMTKRAAKNMAFQGLLAENDKIPESVTDLEGSAMLGSLVHAPLSFCEQGVYVLPMETVLENKGTGVVTCVPSDSPDDYATVLELRKKAEYYGIKPEWIDETQYEIVPLIETPSYGNLCAKFLVEKFKISSPKDQKPLAEAKELAYKEGFYQGKMLVGKYAGEKVETAKPRVRQDLINAGEAMAYAEPEGLVQSRSGDECIVAEMDQWYLDYGEAEWRRQALDYVEKGLNTYGSDTKHAFVGVLNWLNQWACARTYGLGSKLPWDPQYLVESLSDSTVYMSYYTISHFLHTDIFGRNRGSLDIKPDAMTDDVFDYIFCRTKMSDRVSQSGISRNALESMRRSFEYWYPMDLRVSGKDLIPNHLTFCLYNHLAIWDKEWWPRGMRCNGHLMLNGEKMSKSKGNFMTLHDVVGKYGADATRIALADAGDGIGDANFEENVADNSILTLYTKREVFQELARDKEKLRTGELNDFQDKLFENEMHKLVHEARGHYVDFNFKNALQSAFFLFNSAFSFYKEACAAEGIEMNQTLVLRYMELQALIMSVITPHWSEYVWMEILKHTESIQSARWPDVQAPNAARAAQLEYVRMTSSNINSAEGSALKKRAKGKDIAYNPKLPKKLTIFTTEAFPAWQEKYITLLTDMWDPITLKVDDKQLMSKIPKADIKKVMPFLQNLKRRLMTESFKKVMDRRLLFAEQKTLLAMVPGIKRTAGFRSIDVVLVKEGSKQGINLTDGNREVEITQQAAENAVPGQPTFAFENVEA